MRHDCGSFQLALNVPITVVSKHLRHASVDQTAKVYAHILQGDERRGADALAAKWAAMRAAQEIAV
jgi:integrase